MEPYLLQLFLVFILGLTVGIIIMLLVNKLRSGAMSPSTIKEEYQDYQEKVEEHFEETSKKFKDMTDQYQDLYKHLSVGATTLCRADSVAANLVDNSEPTLELEQKSVEKSVKTEVKPKVETKVESKVNEPSSKKTNEPVSAKPVEEKKAEPANAANDVKPAGDKKPKS